MSSLTMYAVLSFIPLCLRSSFFHFRLLSLFSSPEYVISSPHLEGSGFESSLTQGPSLLTYICFRQFWQEKCGMKIRGNEDSYLEDWM